MAMALFRKANAGDKMVLVIAGLLLGGCTSGTKAVFVNVDAIVLQEKVVPPPATVALTPPKLMPGMSFTIPAQPERIVRDSGGQIDTSIAEIEKTQRDAIHALNLRLRSLYENEVAHFTRDRLAEFEGERAKSFATANDSISKSFQEYGQQRGPLMASLAVTVGWPDPNPASNGDANTMPMVQQKHFLRARELRAALVALDKKFSSEIDSHFAEAQQVSGKKLADLHQLIEVFRQQMNKKADAEAAKQVRATPKELDIRLAGARTTALRAIPAQSVQIPAGTQMSPPPQVTFTGIGNGMEDRRRLVEQELQTWLALNRLRLVKQGQGAPDETEEFRAWRKTLLSDGP